MGFWKQSQVPSLYQNIVRKNQEPLLKQPSRVFSLTTPPEFPNLFVRPFSLLLRSKPKGLYEQFQAARCK